MQFRPQTLIIRHRRENLKKCSLRGLETREDLLFYRYPVKAPLNLEGYIYIQMGAPPLTKQDGNHSLLFLDATWKLAKKMEKTLQPNLSKCVRRSIPPGYVTAYPRRQDDCEDPQTGLATLEALYLAYHILGRSKEGLLEGYHFGSEFLKKNRLDDNQ